MSGFIPYRSMMKHQAKSFERFKDASYFALFFEQRCGKSKVILDIFRYNYEIGKIDTLIVISFPNGVHRVFIDELPKDLPPDFLARTHYFAWASGKMDRGDLREHALAARPHPGPVVVTMNCEALLTPTGWKYLEWLLKQRRAMVVADEAAWAARFSARTKKLLTLGIRPNVIVRAILDGTPVAEGPEDIFYPTQFLKKGLLGYTTRAAFRARYVAFEMEEDVDNPGQYVRKKGYNRRTNTFYDIPSGTQNLDELSAKLQEIGSRVLRADVSDAPPKLYLTRYFALTKKQRRVYDDLREQCMAEIGDANVRVENVLKRMTRLQMVARNYYPPEDISSPCGPCAGDGFQDDGAECAACNGLGVDIQHVGLRRIDEDENPAANALAAELSSIDHPVVIWCRFRQDVLDALDAARSVGRNVYQYDGSIPENEREAAYQEFRSGNNCKDTIVATMLSGLTRGKDLTRAGTVIYYSNEWGLRARLQSEDRAENLMRGYSTSIVDLVAEDTRDLDNITALRNKMSISNMITKDPAKNWI